MNVMAIDVEKKNKTKMEWKTWKWKKYSTWNEKYMRDY